MGLSIRLSKQYNHMYTDYPDAYWSVDNICIYPEGDESYLHFEITAYPSREAKKQKDAVIQEPAAKVIPFGGAVKATYEPELFKATQEIPTNYIFKTSVPNTIAEQKEYVYAFVKDALQNAGVTFSDVLEEGQETLN